MIKVERGGGNNFIRIDILSYKISIVSHLHYTAKYYFFYLFVSVLDMIDASIQNLKKKFGC